MNEAFDCTNCSQLSVNDEEECPSRSLPKGSMHSRKHLHVRYVGGCYSCKVRSQMILVKSMSPRSQQ